MLPTRHRFSPRTQAPDFFALAKRYNSPSFLLYFRKVETQTWQGTVVVPKKVAASAVTRNAIKRRMREVLQIVAAQEPKNLMCLQLALVAKPAILNRDLASITTELHTLLRRTHTPNAA